jgi:ABC-type Fe3+/spermidine/putrescine transport system ATPase subunit
VRDFLGRTDKLPATVTARLSENRVEVSLEGSGIRLVAGARGPNGYPVGQRVLACIRPEDIEVSNQSADGGLNRIRGVVHAFLFLGDRAECYVTAGGCEIMLLVPRGLHLREGQEVTVRLPEEALSLWPS